MHFEIIGTDPAGLRGFFGDLFGWEFDTSGAVAEEVSKPNDYGFIELLTTEDGTGIRGGVGGGGATNTTRCSTSRFPTSGRR